MLSDLHELTPFTSMVALQGTYCSHPHVRDGLGNDKVDKYDRKRATGERYIPSPHRL